MKSFVYLSVILSVLTLALISSCKDEEIAEVRDIDGNLYHTVKIGSQTWMVENLKVVTYNDGTPISKNSDSWYHLEDAAYCDYDNKSINGDVYGRLYNFYAVNSGKLCPKGWHVPSDDEWTVLTNYLGGKDKAGIKLKEAGAVHWAPAYADGTNESGFTALPAGFNDILSGFLDLGAGTWWWSSTIGLSSDEAYVRQLYSYSNLTRNYAYHGFGLSVRCIKD